MNKINLKSRVICCFRERLDLCYLTPSDSRSIKLSKADLAKVSNNSRLDFCKNIKYCQHVAFILDAHFCVLVHTNNSEPTCPARARRVLSVGCYNRGVLFGQLGVSEPACPAAARSVLSGLLRRQPLWQAKLYIAFLPKNQQISFVSCQWVSWLAQVQPGSVELDFWGGKTSRIL